MSLFGKLIDFVTDADGSRADAAIMRQADTAIKERKHLETFGISCRNCKKLAVPIPKTDRNYRCTCGQQFSGPKHPFKFGLYDTNGNFRKF